MRIIIYLAIALNTLFPWSQVRGQETGIKNLVVFSGTCRFQLIKGFFPCDQKVIYSQLSNGRSIVSFSYENTVFSVSGGKDRQPNLENYYLSIDTIRINQKNQAEIADYGMEGECHFQMNKPATKFHYIRCDVYNRRKGSLYNFYLENIQNLDRTTDVAVSSLASTGNLKVSIAECGKSKVSSEKIDYCSFVISHTTDPKILERAFNRRGLAYMDLKRFAEAADDFTAVIRLNPKIAGYYDNRQYAYKALRLLKEAMKDATEAVRLAPTYSFVYRSRGLLLTDLEQYDLAEADFTTAISLAPKDGGLFVDRGKMFVAAKKTHEAVADFTHAIDMDANNAIALRERGLAYKMLGDYAAATADLSLFARLEPGDQEVNRAQHEIQNLQKLPNAVTSPPARLPEAKNSDADKNGSSGTGFFVSPRGYIVTNAHVVNGCKDVQITSGLSPKISARILTQDSANDLALLKSDLRPNTLVPLRVGVRIGENVAVFGFPLIGLLATSGNFSVGIVSALAGLGDDTRYLQISAPVQPGNSGGPVLDQSGNIVGVVVAKLDAINVAAITKDVPQNVNFAIKTSVLTNLLDANGVDYSTGSAGQFLQSADLAERAKSIAVLIECGP